jgi:MraZ protein
MESFIGNSDAKVDVKGRVPIPVVFRRAMQQMEDQRMILRLDIYKNCLVLYPQSAWNAELAKMRERLDEFDEEQRDFYQFFLSEANLMELDALGRILIPKRMLQMANISGDIRFVGVDNTIKLWNPDDYEQFAQETRERFKTNARRFLSKPKTEE